ncbi:MAG: hypothetical protein AAAC47_07220, partial [Pararhizobium sp.]
FGAAIGKRGTSAKDRTSVLNHVGRALGQEMIQGGYSQTDIKTALGIGSSVAAALRREVEARANASGVPGPVSAGPGVTTPRGTFVPAAELARVRGLQAQDPATRNADGTPTAFGAAIGKRGTSVRDGTSVLNHVGRALGQEMIQGGYSQTDIKTALGIGSSAAAALKGDIDAQAVTDADEQSRVAQARNSETSAAQARGYEQRPPRGRGL